ncbi:unnamed protein product [Callosobruchus maculatus]|uniref:GIY-YIG domain-containing protein n=1 Tax=Callosobruchus maculatus TaxID=64391 RepID=A0A653C720_CALMS|nr:unnamed protein product [Callosobruchus maculatus]
MLRKENVKTIYKPTRKIQEYLRTVKDKRDPLTTPGVYRIPCTCGSVYIGTTKRSINTRIAEHKASCRLGHTDKSAVAEHAIKEGSHRIKFEEPQVLAATSSYHARLQRETIEIQKHHNNFNGKEETQKVNRTWIPILKDLKTLPYREGAGLPTLPGWATSPLAETRMLFVLSWVFTAAVMSVVNTQSVIDADPGVDPETEALVNPADTLRCHRVPYTYRVQQSDDNGKQCWDVISVMACWGRCDSNEV